MMNPSRFRWRADRSESRAGVLPGLVRPTAWFGFRRVQASFRSPAPLWPFALLAGLLWISLDTVMAQPDDDALLRKATAAWKRAYYYHGNGAIESAIRYYRLSIDIRPTAEAYTLLGWAFSHKEQYEDAIEACKKAIALDPDFGNPYNDIGAYLIELHRDHEALTWLKKAVRAPRYCCYQFAWVNLGRVHLRQGRTSDARSAFERALQYDQQNRFALEGLAAIEEGRLPNY